MKINEIIIRKIKGKNKLFPYSEAELIKNSAPAGFYDDLLSEPLESEWPE